MDHSLFKNSSIPLVLTASLYLAAITPETIASTGSSWSSQPTWSSREREPTSGRGRAASNSTTSIDSRFNGKDGNISPFSPGSNNFALELGQVFLMGDLGKNSDSIGTRLHYNYGVSELFAFDGSIGYSSHSDGNFSMTTLLAGMRTNLSWYDKVIPYIVYGMGFYRPSYQLSSVSPTGSLLPTGTSLSPVLFGVYLGPGVDLELTKQLFFGAALTFHDAFGSNMLTPNGPVSVGGTFTTFFLHAGFTF